MTNNDMIKIVQAIEECKQKERDMCYSHCLLNPENERKRQYERNLILEGMNRIWYELTERFEKEWKKGA